MALRVGWWISSAASVAVLSVLVALALQRFSPVSLDLIMGQASSKHASVADVLSLDPVEGSSSSVSNAKGGIDVSSLSSGAVDARLLALGVDPARGDPSPSDRGSCLERVSSPDFWRTHHSSHPNAKRVKAWMFVHAKYREQLADVVAMVAKTAAGAGSGKLPELRLATGKFMKKIARHSKFEDEQLFRFFNEEMVPKGDAELGRVLKALSEQHGGGEKNRSEAVTNALASAAAASVEDEKGRVDEERRKAALEVVTEALTAYQGEMLAHLELEERTLVGRWLGLSEETYEIYRDKYLKFPYSFMY